MKLIEMKFSDILWYVLPLKCRQVWNPSDLVPVCINAQFGHRQERVICAQTSEEEKQDKKIFKNFSTPQPRIEPGTPAWEAIVVSTELKWKLPKGEKFRPSVRYI